MLNTDGYAGAGYAERWWFLALGMLTTDGYRCFECVVWYQMLMVAGADYTECWWLQVQVENTMMIVGSEVI